MSYPPLTDRTYAYFYITGPGRHEEITDKLLNLSPSKALSIGDIDYETGQTSQTMFWKRYSGLNDTAAINQHVVELLEIFGSRIYALSNMSDEYTLTIKCIGYYVDSSHGDHLDRENVRLASRMGINFDYNFYYINNEFCCLGDATMSSEPFTKREYAYFSLTGLGSHEEITEKLGFTPSKAWSVGDINPRSKKPYQFMYWQLPSGLDDTRPLESHIESLLVLLGTKQLELRELWTDYDLTIQCVGYYPPNVFPNSHGFQLKRDILHQAAQLGIAFDFDLYYQEHMA